MVDYTNPTFNELIWLDNHLTMVDLILLYGEDLGNHLQEKRERLGNFLYFFNSLDRENKNILGLFAARSV